MGRIQSLVPNPDPDVLEQFPEPRFVGQDAQSRLLMGLFDGYGVIILVPGHGAPSLPAVW